MQNTPTGGWSNDRPLTNRDRELAGLNPHARVRNGAIRTPVDDSLEGNPGKNMDALDLIDLLKQAKEEHPEQPFIQATYLHYYEGTPVSELSIMMDCSRSTVRTRMAATLKFLKEYIRGNQ